MPDQAAQDTRDFEAAFAEAADKQSTVKATDAARDAEQDEKPADGDSGANATNQAADAKGVAAGQASTEQQAPAGQDASLRDQLAEALRARDAALHQQRSDAGRQSAAMRENNALKAQVEALAREVAALKQGATAPGTKPDDEATDAADALDDTPEFRAAVERRIAGAAKGLQARIDAAETKLAEVSLVADRSARAVEPIAAREQREHFEAIRKSLDLRFPAWRKEMRDIASWVDTQPEQVRAMFPGTNLAEASSVLALYYADKSASVPATTATSNGSGDRVRQAAGIAPRIAATQTPENNDFDSAFAEFAAKNKRRPTFKVN